MNPPAFQFYADDFLSGTMILDQAETGAYIRLLCAQWSLGGLPDNAAKLERLAGGPVTPDVLAKIPVGTDGMRRNLRMESERQKQAEYKKKQSEKGLAGAEARWHGHGRGNGTGIAQALPAPMPKPMPEQWPQDGSPSPSPSSTPTSEKTSPKGECEADKPRRTPTERSPAGGLDEVKAFFASNGGTEVDALDFFDHYEANGWMQGKVAMRQWKAAARRWCRGNVNGQRAFHLNGSRHPPRGHSESKQIQEDIQCPVWSAT